MSSIFFQKQTNDSYRFISELMDVFFLWLVFTSNLNSRTTWLEVKLKLVNLNLRIGGDGIFAAFF